MNLIWVLILRDFVQSFEEGDNAEFSVINSNLFDLYLEHSDSVRDAPLRQQ